MKYAVISDIHGNYPALEACLKDARGLGVSRFLYLGDYFLDIPYPNEATETVRETAYAAVRGNKEDYLREMNWDRRTWTFDQFNSLYWNCEQIKQENADYLISLPFAKTIKDDHIYMAHMASDLFEDASAVRFGSGGYYFRMKEKPFSHAEFLQHIDETISTNKPFNIKLELMPDGAYLFGHTHIQWHWSGFGKLILNPGSCGLSLNFDNRAAYSIIEYTGGAWNVDERRVEYDAEGTARVLRESGLYKAAPGFSGVILEQIESAEERVSFLIKTAETEAFKRGESGQPFSNAVWREACRRYMRGPITQRRQP
ncbi:MAG: metallophosphatase family protein [Clostridiales bacterium]|jgi:predicted phosphodiesterase|nr:metallophosphatase family protein [Clostridiales bacterium]